MITDSVLTKGVWLKLVGWVLGSMVIGSAAGALLALRTLAQVYP
jgi:hypothetical protein